jgi:hypothetical protein
MPTITRPDLAAAALASLVAAAVAFAIGLLDPFDHGAWLVAYLVLVGFAAQLLLGLGQTALLAQSLPEPSRSVRLTQTFLWNLGVVAVPLGVVAEARLAVVGGSVSLLAALDSFRTSAHLAPTPAPRRPRSLLACGYAVLLAAMAVSTVIGTALTWDFPWT